MATSSAYLDLPHRSFTSSGEENSLLHQSPGSSLSVSASLKTLEPFSLKVNNFRDFYVLPIMGDRSQVLTPDAVTALYLVKMREVILSKRLNMRDNMLHIQNVDFEFLGFLFGVCRRSASDWFHKASAL